MRNINKRLYSLISFRLPALLVALFAAGTAIHAQQKIVNPEISYAGTSHSYEIGGIEVSGVESEGYMLAGVSGLSVGQTISVPGSQITDAVKRYWKQGLFSDVSISADSIVGNKIYLHVFLTLT